MADATALVQERPRRSGLGRIGVSSAVAAVLATLLHVVAGRALGTNGYAHFLVVWGLFFTLTGILPGLQQEVIRTVATARLHDLHGHQPVFGSLVIGVGGLVLILATCPVWAPRVLDRQAIGVGAVLAVGFFGYTWANHVNGALAATHRWQLYARAILLDGVARFLLVGTLLLLLHKSYVAWALGLVAPALVWGLLAISSEVRTATMAAGDAGTVAFVRRSAHSMLSAGCSAIVVAGFPVLLQLFAGRARNEADAGTVLAVLMATRAPLLLFLNAYQGVWITRLVDSSAPIRLMARWIGVAVLFSVPTAGAAYLLGPRVLRLVFGSDYIATRGLFVELVVSGLVLGVITLTGWTALALGRHTLFVSGWLTAVVATSAQLTVPLTLEGRVSLSLIVGPLIGAAVHLLTLHGSARAHERPGGHDRVETPGLEATGKPTAPDVEPG